MKIRIKFLDVNDEVVFTTEWKSIAAVEKDDETFIREMFDQPLPLEACAVVVEQNDGV